MDNDITKLGQNERREELLARLRDIAEKYNGSDEEAGHGLADDALLEYINDPEVTAAFEAVGRWYA